MPEKEKINIHDCIFGYVYVPDHHDDPEIKQMWKEFGDFSQMMSHSLRAQERRDSIIHGCLMAAVYVFVIANVFFIHWILN